MRKTSQKEMSDYGERYDLDVAAGAYGTGVVPTFFVLLIDARSDENTDDIFNEFVGGMTSGGASADTSAITSGERDGLEYRCVPVAAAQIQAAACMWRDDGSFGVVFRFDAGVNETTDLLGHDSRRGCLTRRRQVDYPAVRTDRPEVPHLAGGDPSDAIPAVNALTAPKKRVGVKEGHPEAEATRRRERQTEDQTQERSCGRSHGSPPNDVPLGRGHRAPSRAWLMHSPISRGSNPVQASGSVPVG